MVAGQGFEPWILYSRSKNLTNLDHPTFILLILDFLIKTIPASHNSVYLTKKSINLHSIKKT